MGKLVVYQWLMRPSAFRQHFQRASPLKPLVNLAQTSYEAPYSGILKVLSHNKDGIHAHTW